MKGAILGDIIGSRLERSGAKDYNFELFTTKCRFTDDTVLTVAVADAILNQLDYGETIKDYALRYPDAGYGGTFKKWMRDEPDYAFDVSCAGSVPESIIAFLDSKDLIDSIRLAISLGGDTDTQAAMAGSISEAFYGPVPAPVEDVMNAFLPNELIDVIGLFERALQVG